MDPNQDPKLATASPAAVPTASGATVVPTTTAQVNSSKIDDGFVEFKEHSSLNFPLFLTWTAAILSVVATLFFWWMNKNEADALADKKVERDALTQELSSPGSVDVEKKAQDFKLSVSQLKKANTEKYSYSTFLSDLYKKITKDTKMTGISITNDGLLTLTGTTSSYRQVADLMVALQGWDTLSNVDLLSVSVDDKSGTKETVFAISAKIDKTKRDTVNQSASASSQSLGSGQEGGSNAEI